MVRRAARSLPDRPRHVLWRALQGTLTPRELVWECLATLPEMTLRRRTAHGDLYYSNRDDVIGRHLFVYGAFEAEKIDRAVRVARHLGMITDQNRGFFIDGGANIGTVSIKVIRERIFSQAIAFEPEPCNYRLLRRNVARNGLESQIVAVASGLSSVDGTLEMELSPWNRGDHRVRASAPLTAEQLGERHWRTITAPMARLDTALCAATISWNDVRFLWLDVQGHETFVLKGAEGLGAKRVPTVIEFAPYMQARAGVDPGTFLECLTHRFGSFYDLADETPQRCAIRGVANLFRRYAGHQATDLLLVRD